MDFLPWGRKTNFMLEGEERVLLMLRLEEATQAATEVDLQIRELGLVGDAELRSLPFVIHAVRCVRDQD